jgi:hypothetical protein
MLERLWPQRGRWRPATRYNRQSVPPELTQRGPWTEEPNWSVLRLWCVCVGVGALRAVYFILRVSQASQSPVPLLLLLFCQGWGWNPGNGFCSQGTMTSLFPLCVCVSTHTQYLLFSRPQENRRCHEAAMPALMNSTAQPEIQVLNFQWQTKGLCSSPGH